MRKTLFAMVGLLALGVWALPAFAGNSALPGASGTSTVSTSTSQGDLPMVSEPAPLENRAGRLGAMARGDVASYKGTLSGTLIKQGQVASTTWFLYPNACAERAAGTWSPKSAIVADSLNTYDPLTQNHGYEILDNSLKEVLWHVTDGTDALDGAPVVISGTRSLWCGKYDVNWVVKSGYPNLTFQILYIDSDPVALGGGTPRTSTAATTYDLAWQGDINSEFNYDYVYLIGGGDGATNRDPIGNSRARLDKIRNDGLDGNAELLITMTGAQNTNQTLAYVAAPGNLVEGDFSGESVTSWSLSGIPSDHRGLYFLFYADCLYSGEDGLWPEGHGQILDNIQVTDSVNGLQAIYTDEASELGGPDPYDGVIIKSISGNYAISARVAPGVGGVWSIQAGNTLPTSDYCSPQKQLASDKMFLGADATSKLTLANEYASVVECSFGVPTGTASVFAIFSEYLDLPRQSGYVQNNEFKVYKDGIWSNWIDPTDGSVITGARQSWGDAGDELAEAATADSVQVRLNIQCINFFAVDHVNCQPVTYGIIYDNLRLQIVTGVPAPLFNVFVSSVPQSMFVDGTDPLSVGCTPGQISAGQCWPGVRGSNVAAVSGPIHNNFNNAYGDSNTLNLLTGLRKNGMGINWQWGFTKSILGGFRIAMLNGGYNPAFGTPMWIYRIYDPATYTWSPWDSSALDANSAEISGPDTVVVGSRYRFDWPPRDKYYVNQGGADIGPDVDANLPGVPGWTLNGNTKYSQVPFLPRGTRIQYYFKAVDVGGGVSWQFSTNNLAFETDLPTLPGSSIKAPDIIEFHVLPDKYPVGTGNLAGSDSSRILNLDGSYTAWSNGFDPVTQALRAMGVRADRFRLCQGLDNGGNFGGHEFPGSRVTRLSNYFPNTLEYGIKDLLANHYRIMIQSSHQRSSTIFAEEDANLASQWWITDTGVNGGDRGIFASGDGLFNALLNASKSFPQFAEQVNLAQNVFGVASCIDAWSGANTTQYPTIDDRFTGGGPGLAAPGTFTYPVDGGCPAPNRFDGLTKIGPAEAQNAVIYPGGVPEVAGITYSTEKDAGGSTDNDRNKAMALAFSIQFIRSAGIPTTAANYVHSGVENRMKVMYKFITGIRNTTPSTTPCWPCPANFAEMTSNWATATGFQTATYGGILNVQDYTQATGVEVSEAAPKVNRLEGNYPNPFNPETAIRFSAATPGKVTVRIFDVAGRLVNTLTKNVTETGLNEIRWNGKSSDGRSMASGLYFYRIRFANGQQSEAKMTMLK